MRCAATQRQPIESKPSGPPEATCLHLSDTRRAHHLLSNAACVLVNLRSAAGGDFGGAHRFTLVAVVVVVVALNVLAAPTKPQTSPNATGRSHKPPKITQLSLLLFFYYYHHQRHYNNYYSLYCTTLTGRFYIDLAAYLRDQRRGEINYTRLAAYFGPVFLTTPTELICHIYFFFRQTKTARLI